MEHNPEPSAKRRKRTIFRACENCAMAKTRCEDVDIVGCSLCRRRKKVCSLAGHVDEADDHPSAPRMGREGTGERRDSVRWGGPDQSASPAGANLDQRVRQLEQDVRDLQGQMTAVGGSAAVSRRSSHLPVADRWDGARGHVPFVDIHSQPGIPYSDAMYTIQAADNPYPSVLARDLMTPDQVDMAFHTFKHSIAPLCPLSIWLSVSTPTPSHPFVILAMLHHVPAFATHPDLTGMVDECLLLILRAQVDEEVVLALLILALAPAINAPDAAVRPNVSALKLITLAYDMGRSLGLSAAVKRTIRDMRDPSDPEWRDALNQLEMWSAVVDRYNLLQILFGNPETLVQLPEYAPPYAPTLYMTHHYQLQELNRLAFAALHAISMIEEEPQDLTQAETHMEIYRSNFDALRTQPYHGITQVSLLADSLCCRQTLCLRITTFSVRLPTPLRRIREICRTGRQCIKATCSDALLHFIPDPSNPPARLTCPGYAAQAGMVACLMMLAAVWYVKASLPAALYGVDPDRLCALVKLLKEVDPVMRVIIDKTEAVYGKADSVAQVVADSQSHATQGVAQQSELDLGGIPLDPAQMFDLDLLGWDFLLPEWTQGLEPVL